MSRRRKSDHNESLDLLLDTITNAFGGLIFIALLIAIMVGKKQPNENKTRAIGETGLDAAANPSLTVLEAELDLLKQQQASALELSKKFANPLQQEMITELQTVQRSIASRKKQNEQMLVKTDASRTSNKDLEFELASIDSDIESIKKRQSSAERKLDQEKKKRTTDIDAPKERETSKRSILLIARRGKLYQVRQNPNRLQDTFSINKTHFSSASSNSAELQLGRLFGNWKTIPSAGIPMDSSSSVAKMLNPFSNQSSFVQIAIYEDSFANFKAVRELLVEENFEYSLLVLKMNDQISESASSTRPKVQ